MSQEIEVYVIPNGSPFEYFCGSCHQLRLAFEPRSDCGNCGSDKLTLGAVGTLDKAAIIRAALAAAEGGSNG